MPHQTAPAARVRVRVALRGAVQGVGFRPFVQRLATELALAGWVGNSAQGLFLEAEGELSAVEELLRRLQSEHPPPSFIQSQETTWLDTVGGEKFEIRASRDHGPKTALVLPDIATCPDCRREILDPNNRRFRYPFTNCTRCGPRFSIIEALPYDRANTAMKKFVMCPACQSEYEDPRDRRFHAQPNACPECGPRLEFWRACGQPETAAAGLPRGARHEVLSDGFEALLCAVESIRAGGIVAVKGVGGFHLLVDARSEEAVRRLRERKHREEKPFALLFPSLAAVADACVVSPAESRLLQSPEAPIVLLAKSGDARSSVALSVAPGNSNLGVMLPSNPLQHLFMAEFGFPVVATSGNLSDEPLCTDEREAVERLHGLAEYFLIHDRPIVRHVDDSIVRVVLGREMVLRRARGYAPLPITIFLGADGDGQRTMQSGSLPPKHERLLTPPLSSMGHGGEGGRRPGEEALGGSEAPRANLSENSLLGLRSSRREEAPSEILETKLEPPHVGCHSSGVQLADGPGNSRPEPEAGGTNTSARPSPHPDSESGRGEGETLSAVAQSHALGGLDHGPTVNSRPTVLGVGAHLKSAVAFAVGDNVFISQHIGDLETVQAEQAWRRVIADFERLYEVKPDLVAADLHPDYLSTQFALKLRPPVQLDGAAGGAVTGGPAVVRVQHHVAHVLACLAENATPLPALGVAWDGAGYGADGTIWGGEFFLATSDAVERVASLRPFRLPGGDAGAREPRRAALGMLFEMQGKELFGCTDLPPVAAFSAAELTLLQTMLERGLNSPVCSSMGRWFDAVAALLDLRQRARFEGQAAMDLEFAIGGAVTDKFYELPLVTRAGLCILDWGPVLGEIGRDARRGVLKGEIAAKFHNTLAEVVVAVARRLGVARVALSGGCFQNRYLLERTVTRLRAEKLQPYWPQRVPPNDGGIALGQVLGALRARAPARTRR